MSLEEAIYFAAIVLVGLPAAFRMGANAGIRNATAFAMVATWFAGRLIYVVTGDGMPVRAMILFDWAVIVTIFAKKDWRICSPHKGIDYLLCFVWHERSPWDRAIIALFPVVWIFYAPVTDPRTQYWVLWALGLGQLILAGREALQPWLRVNGQKPRADAPEQPPPRLDFHAPAWGGDYG